MLEKPTLKNQTEGNSDIEKQIGENLPAVKCV